MITQRLTLPLRDRLTETDSAAIERALLAVPGVVYAYISPITEMAYVIADVSLGDADALVRAVARLGEDAGAPSLR